jgi:anti-anti-sigma factor
MGVGKILISDQSDNYLLKLVGDVRLTLSASLSRYMDGLFKNSNVKRVIIDMQEAEGVDSTTLGLIAKLGLHCRKCYNINVQLFCQNPSILRTLDCMGLADIIDICKQLPAVEGDLHCLEAKDTKIDELREQVLESHKLLRQLNPENSVEFSDLIKALESEIRKDH